MLLGIFYSPEAGAMATDHSKTSVPTLMLQCLQRGTLCTHVTPMQQVNYSEGTDLISPQTS